VRGYGVSETATRRFCGNCGNELQDGDRFCRSCGARVDLAFDAAEAPSTVADRRDTGERAAFQPREVPPADTGSGRPRWLLPGIVGAAVLVGLLVAVAILLFSSGEQENQPAFAEAAQPVVAPVVAAAANLADTLSDAEESADLPTVAAAGQELERATSTATGAASVLRVDDEEAEQLELLRAALTASGQYAQRLIAASEQLSRARASAAETAADAALNRWTSLAAAGAGIDTPDEQAFTAVAQLATIATAREERAAEHARGQAAARGYVEKIDRLLTNSAETRDDLGALITDVQDNTIAASEARARIAAIINQRQGLQNAVASIDVPPAFRRSSELLRASITAALDDDFAIQGWINAWYDYDARSYERFYSEHEQATARASAAKRAFVDEYDRVRKRRLKLGPSPAADRY
jgi:zinc-ribbon domain